MIFADGPPDQTGRAALVVAVLGAVGTFWVNFRQTRRQDRKEEDDIDAAAEARNAKEDERIARHYKAELKGVQTELKGLRAEHQECLEQQIRQEATNHHLARAIDVLQAKLRDNGTLDDSAVHQALPPAYKKGDSKRSLPKFPPENSP